ncbi:pVIII [Psittacine adenovirus 3]|uniref:PVIII n=1 Tax=Psittacine adenovirus 3 TaxID=1580497 RepID=A0A0A7JT16_9ADEN|nr:pVIII [Psittacine adenovirus 3]AIZ35778.1 pVIII [Psittacine adenovirus 3]
MTAPVTPYLWTYQPQTGYPAGARQDYGSVPCWFNSAPDLYHRIMALNEERNLLDVGRSSARAFQVSAAAPASSYLPAKDPSLADSVITDKVKTWQGEQLAGGSYRLGDGRQYRKLSRDSSPFPHNWQVYEDGSWKTISGGSCNALSSYPRAVYADLETYSRPGQQIQAPLTGRGKRLDSVHLLTEEATVPRQEGLTPLQFLSQFPPVVYSEPFSGNLAYFPKEFSPLFEPSKDPRRVTDYSLKYAAPPVM